MIDPTFEMISVGDTAVDLQIDPITRTTLALYAGGSGDHNPMHIDSDFAKQAGMPDVFAHGMLVMGYVARAITDVFPQEWVPNIDVRFVAITQVSDVLTCTGLVRSKDPTEGGSRLTIDISVRDAAGELKLSGEATIASSH